MNVYNKVRKQQRVCDVNQETCLTATALQHVRALVAARAVCAAFACQQ